MFEFLSIFCLSLYISKVIFLLSPDLGLISRFEFKIIFLIFSSFVIQRISRCGSDFLNCFWKTIN